MAGLMEYKCPNCGGAVNFDSASQQMKCPFCDATFEVGALKAHDEALKSGKTDDMEWHHPGEGGWQEGEKDGLRVYVCKSCAGEIIGDAATAATSCPYCGNPVVMSGQFSGGLRPDCVIPFKLDKKAAKQAFSNHLEGKSLLPKVFKDQNHLDEIKGVYVPFWLFDAKAGAEISYTATKDRVWSDNKFDYTETSHYHVKRAGSLAFDKVPVNGSSKMPADLMESVEPYDMKAAVDFQTAYLAGYLADKYDVGSEASVARANDRIKQSTEDSFAATVTGYGGFNQERSQISLEGGTMKYALLPVWVLHTTWDGKKFVFAMNGQTGKFVGDLPTDSGAFWGRFFMLTVIIGVVLNILMTILGL